MLQHSPCSVSDIIYLGMVDRKRGLDLRTSRATSLGSRDVDRVDIAGGVPGQVGCAELSHDDPYLGGLYTGAGGA